MKLGAQFDDYGIAVGDCLELLPTLPSGSIDLILTSPPYNIGKAFEPRRSVDEYVDWCAAWIDELRRVVTPAGAIWLNLGYLDAGAAGCCVPIAYLLWAHLAPLHLVQQVIWAQPERARRQTTPVAPPRDAAVARRRPRPVPLRPGRDPRPGRRVPRTRVAAAAPASTRWARTLATSGTSAASRPAAAPLSARTTRPRCPWSLLAGSSPAAALAIVYSTRWPALARRSSRRETRNARRSASNNDPTTRRLRATGCKA